MAKTFKKSKTQTERVDVYQRVTDSIIASLEQGVRPWTKPWTQKGGNVSLPLRHDGKPYRGINVFLLWSDAITKGFTSPYWMTFNQAKEYKGSVKAGEKGSFVIYANMLAKPNKDDPKKIDKIFYMKGYTVFNADQCENLPERFQPKPVVLTEAEAKAATVAKIDHAEAFFAKVGGVVKHAPNRAFYSPAGDFISLPEIADFKDAEGYYATLGHEFCHWTGHKDRLNRTFGATHGDELYAREELVAELGSAFICAHLGVALTPREDHASYLASWLKVLKGDKRFIVQAASKAQAAVEDLKTRAGEGAVVEAEEEIAEAA